MRMGNSSFIDIGRGVRMVIVWSLIAAGTVEAVWGLLQVYSYLPSNHSLYALTGSFYNPGPYSGFLSMCLPLALDEWLEGKRVRKHIALAALVLMLLVLPSGMSRSAWLAALVASAGVLGVGICLSAYGYRQEHPVRKVHAMFDRAHSLHEAGDWQSSTELLKETMKVSSDAMVLNIIGKNCQALGEYEEAEAWFIRSTHRLPNRIYPYYLLAKLYAEHPEVFPREKLEWAARMVMEKEAKVESTAIRQMREEVNALL